MTHATTASPYIFEPSHHLARVQVVKHPVTGVPQFNLEPVGPGRALSAVPGQILRAGPEGRRWACVARLGAPGYRLIEDRHDSQQPPGALAAHMATIRGGLRLEPGGLIRVAVSAEAARAGGLFADAGDIRDSLDAMLAFAGLSLGARKTYIPRPDDAAGGLPYNSGRRFDADGTVRIDRLLYSGGALQADRTAQASDFRHQTRWRLARPAWAIVVEDAIHPDGDRTRALKWVYTHGRRADADVVAMKLWGLLGLSEEALHFARLEDMVGTPHDFVLRPFTGPYWAHAMDEALGLARPEPIATFGEVITEGERQVALRAVAEPDAHAKHVEELKALRCAELRALLRARGVEGVGRMPKHQLISIALEM